MRLPLDHRFVYDTLRAKLGEALARHSVAPHVFETEPEALAHLAAQSAAPPA